MEATRSGAEQEAFVPPFDSLHDQVHGPVPVTVVAVLLALQRFEDGVVEAATPFAEPQDPLVEHRSVQFRYIALGLLQTPLLHFVGCMAPH